MEYHKGFLTILFLVLLFFAINWHSPPFESLIVSMREPGSTLQRILRMVPVEYAEILNQHRWRRLDYDDAVLTNGRSFIGVKQQGQPVRNTASRLQYWKSTVNVGLEKSDKDETLE